MELHPELQEADLMEAHPNRITLEHPDRITLPSHPSLTVLQCLVHSAAGYNAIHIKGLWWCAEEKNYKTHQHTRTLVSVL